MRPTAKITRAQVGLVHVAKAQLKAAGVLTEEDYRELLARFGDGAKSSQDLTQEQLKRLMEHFKKCGFRQAKARPKVEGAPDLSRAPEEKRPYLAKIEGVLAELKLPWAYADAIAKKMGYGEKLIWCEPEELRKVLAALIYKKTKNQDISRKDAKTQRKAQKNEPVAQV